MSSQHRRKTPSIRICEGPAGPSPRRLRLNFVRLSPPSKMSWYKS
jgi:hypothetical protein